MLVLAIVIGVAGTVVLAGVAGARRTASSFDRFVESTRAYDVLVFFRRLGPSTVSQVRSLPGVEAAALVDVPAVQFGDGDFIAAGAPTDDVVFRDIAVPRIVEGRDTEPGASRELVIGEPLATRRGIEVGDSVVLDTFTPEQIAALVDVVGSPIPEPAGPRVRMKVVGISRSPVDLSQQGDAGGILLLPRAFIDTYGDRVGSYIDVVLVRLADGSAGVPGFVRDLRQQFRDDPDTVIDEVEPTAVSTSGVRESIDVLATGLAVFAVIAAISALVVVGLMAARFVALGAERQQTWLALGLTRAQRIGALAFPPLVSVVVGASLAFVGAWIASALMPIGLARRAEPHPGVDFDVLVLVVGSAALIAALSAIVLSVAWRQARTSSQSRAPSHVATARVVQAAGLAPTVSIGLRAALQPTGRGRVISGRATLAVVIVAVLGVVSVSIFGPSLDRLAKTPALFGVGWDVAVDDARAERPDPSRPCSGLRSTRVDASPVSTPLPRSVNLSVEIEGHPVFALGYTPMRGSIDPTVLEGRAPAATDEIALGSASFDTVSRDVGDDVRLEGPGGAETFRIVGRVVLPSLGESQAVADGAILTGKGLDRVDDPDAQLSHAWVVATLAETAAKACGGASTGGAARRGRSGDPGGRATAVPLEVRRLQQVEDLPKFLAVLPRPARCGCDRLHPRDVGAPPAARARLAQDHRLHASSARRDGRLAGDRGRGHRCCGGRAARHRRRPQRLACGRRQRRRRVRPRRVGRDRRRNRGGGAGPRERGRPAGGSRGGSGVAGHDLARRVATSRGVTRGGCTRNL